MSAIVPEVVGKARRATDDAWVERRSMDQAIRKHQRKQNAEEVLEARDDAVTSKALDRYSLEEIANLIVRRSANIMLLGGAHFLPTSPREATDLAKDWARIADGQAALRLKQAEIDARAAAMNAPVQPVIDVESTETPPEPSEIEVLAKRIAAQIIANRAKKVAG